MCDGARLIGLADRLEGAVGAEPDWQSWDAWVEEMQVTSLEVADALRLMAGAPLAPLLRAG